MVDKSQRPPRRHGDVFFTLGSRLVGEGPFIEPASLSLATAARIQGLQLQMVVSLERNFVAASLCFNDNTGNL